MESTFKVPIRNLFCLLSYASEMPELIKQFSDVDEDIITYDFLADRFNKEAEHLLRRGLRKDYINNIEKTTRLAGRVLMNESMPLIMEKKPALVCKKDEYSRNILLNQIMRTTLEGIYRNRYVSNSIRNASFELCKQLPDIDSVHLNREIFLRLHFNRLTLHYKSMIHLARLLYELRLLSHKNGNWNLFHAELDDQALNHLFEKFLLGFYKVEQNYYRVGSEKMQWKLRGESSFLPKMQTDISLINKDKQEKIIMDAKFYKNIYQYHFGKSTFHSHNMYQIFTYLMHQPKELNVRGILIYPYNGYLVEESYQWSENTSLKIISINLDDSWASIFEKLLSVIDV